MDKQEYIARCLTLQRSELDDQDGLSPEEVRASLRTAIDPSEPLPLWYAEVRGISHLKRTAAPSERQSPYPTKEILAGLNGQKIPIYFLLRGDPMRIRVFLGTAEKPDGEAVRSLFESYYPGLRMSDADAQLREARGFLAACGHIGIITGIPTPAAGEGGESVLQVDRLVRGLYSRDSSWAMLVLATAEADKHIIQRQLAVINEMIRVEQEEKVTGWSESLRQSTSSYYIQLLQMQEQLCETCLAEGAWSVQSYICSPDQAAYLKAKALVKSVYSGDYSRADRIRVLDCPGAGPKAASFSPVMVEQPPSSFQLSLSPFKYHTLVSSGQLAALIHLPQVEMPGYYVKESVPFDVSSHVPHDEPAIEIGEILNQGAGTGNAYRVPLRELTAHALVVGITGGGKTHTIKHLIRQLQEQPDPVPLMVIEPAKREYRMLGSVLPKDRALRVFTLGEADPDAAPFKINPFEIRPGVSVQTHIDLLKSVFLASFGLWNPMPQILERAIHEIYRDKGWDVVRGTNDRAADGKGKGVHPFAHPTLTDLFHKVGEIVPALGYDQEAEQRIRTGLETRINGLRIGAKGMMLDGSVSIPIEHLLDGPTVLELEGIGDDDEKAFLMGLILVALYEYYRTKPAAKGGLRHVTIIEEAHRLLANAAGPADPDAANLRGKAVETFVSMLSEVRAYGEGFIVAEQIPNKLAPDVIKNTSLKIMHRIVSRDDREAMGSAMNLDARQLRRVVSLGRGDAVVHCGGRFADDNAMLLHVPPMAGKRKEKKAAAGEIRAAFDEFVSSRGLADAFRSYPTCEQFCREGSEVCGDARRIAEDPTVREGFSIFLLTAIVDGLHPEGKDAAGILRGAYPSVQKAIRTLLPGRAEDPHRTRCILTHALYRFLGARGSQFGWRYTEIERMAGEILPLILASDSAGTAAPSTAALTAFAEEFAAKSRLTFEPFYGCGLACGEEPVCLYRLGVAGLLGDENLESSFIKAGEAWEDLARVCLRAAIRCVEGETDAERLRAPAFCYAIQKTHSNRSVWSVMARREMIDNLASFFGQRDAD
jgi:hypothetical protein